MKSIINSLTVLFATFGITLGFIGDPNFKNSKIDYPQSTYIEYKIDSIDKVITNIHEGTNKKLETDNQVFLNEKKKLLYMDIRIDSLATANNLEDTGTNVLLPITTKK